MTSGIVACAFLQCTVDLVMPSVLAHCPSGFAFNLEYSVLA